MFFFSSFLPFVYSLFQPWWNFILPYPRLSPLFFPSRACFTHSFSSFFYLLFHVFVLSFLFFFILFSSLYFLLCLSCFIHSFILLLFSIFSFPLSVNLLYLSCLLHSLRLISVLPFVSLAHIFISYLCCLHHSFSHGPSPLLVPAVSHLVSMCHGAVCIWKQQLNKHTHAHTHTNR